MYRANYALDMGRRFLNATQQQRIKSVAVEVEVANANGISQIAGAVQLFE